ncbi:MAG: low molecular weight protein arginine phosphatase [Calditrichaeota bacterium]|nr:low molecular weight protein arginine phosphatase [Calditrichota bacterium]
MSKPYHILFVCSGNACRSPMAEGLLKKKLYPEFLKKVEIESAGTLGFIDSPATDYAVKAAEEKGVDISSHKSQPLTRELVDKTDLILVMANHHKDFIRNHFPDSIDKVFLLTEFAKDDLEDRQDFPPIPDPIGETLSFYRKIIEQIDRELVRILAILREQIEEQNNEETK